MTAATDRPQAPVELETGPDPSATVIWLHGLGADGHDFEALVPELGLPDRPALRFVFPHAPYRPVTLNRGYVMRAWYDIAMGAQGLTQDAAHIAESAATITALIAHEERRGIPARRIVLAGFSQGGVVALSTGLRHPQTLAGILALSVPLVTPEALAGAVHPANRTTPVFLAHGRYDPLVPFARGEHVHRVLAGAGLPVEWHAYPMEHSVCREEVRDIAAWLARVLPAP